MPMKRRATQPAWAGALLVLATIQSTHAASFEGTWSVLQVCETTSEGARGYTWRYDVTITNGHLIGHRGTIQGGQSQFTLEGTVQSGGRAALTGTGISETSDYNLGFAQRGTPNLL